MNLDDRRLAGCGRATRPRVQVAVSADHVIDGVRGLDALPGVKQRRMLLAPGEHLGDVDQEAHHQDGVAIDADRDLCAQNSDCAFAQQ